MSTVHVIGGGIGGLCTALSLQRQDIPVQVHERAATLRGLGAGLTLQPNAVLALRAMGLEAAVSTIAHPLGQMRIRTWRGRTLGQTDLAAMAEEVGAPAWAVHRARLHELLIRLLPPETLRLGQTLVGLDPGPASVRLDFAGEEPQPVPWLIGADGINSAVRQGLGLAPNLRYSGYTCWRGVVQADLPPGESTETWGPAGRFGIVPLRGGLVYWFATCDAPPQDPHMAAWGVEDLLQNFARYPADVRQVLAATRPEDLLWHDISDFPPLRAFHRGRVLLLGDAAHATTPNMGQGACMAIEDAAVVGHLVQAHGLTPETWARFSALRVGRTRAIVKRSYQLGRMGQWGDPLRSGLRNALLRLVPAKMTRQQLKALYEVDLATPSKRLVPLARE